MGRPTNVLNFGTDGPLVATLPHLAQPQRVSLRIQLTVECLICIAIWCSPASRPASIAQLIDDHTYTLLYRSSSLVPLVFLAWNIYSLTAVPRELAHLPRVPLWPLLKSYARGEADHIRITRLILPYAEAGHGVVLVWILGRWMLNILSSDLARAQAEKHNDFPKESPPDGMLLWEFAGKEPVQLVNGAKWRKQARVIKGALGGTVPIPVFTELGNKLLSKLGAGGRVQFDHWAQRYTLETIGKTSFGYNFNSLDDPTWMLRFNDVMHAIASIPYIVFPFLETIWPRHAVHKSIADFKHLFDTVIAQARAEKDKTVQHGMLSLILEHGSLSEDEIRDNLVVFFLAGHDSTAGTMSSVMYYLATHPEVQAKARAQVKAALGDSDPMDADDFKDMTYVLACIREALRLNPPFLSGVPRTCDTYFRLGQYIIPPHTSFITNIYAMQHSSTEWEDPFVYRPERHLDISSGDIKTQDEWLPFLSGPRGCSGRNFALYELQTALCLILRKFQWTLTDDSIHKDSLKNAFSAFGFNIPHDVRGYCTEHTVVLGWLNIDVDSADTPPSEDIATWSRGLPDVLDVLNVALHVNKVHFHDM